MVLYTKCYHSFFSVLMTPLPRGVEVVPGKERLAATRNRTAEPYFFPQLSLERQ
jgi:hypothetical protein